MVRSRKHVYLTHSPGLNIEVLADNERICRIWKNYYSAG